MLCVEHMARELITVQALSDSEGFEPLRAEPHGFLVHHLNPSVALLRIFSTCNLYARTERKCVLEHARCCACRCILTTYTSGLFWNSGDTKKWNSLMSTGGFANTLCVVGVQSEMYVWTILWNPDDTKKDNKAMPTGWFANLLCLWFALDEACTSGLYVGVVTTPRQIILECRREGLPALCGW